MNKSIDENNYTFSQYFLLPQPVEEILAEFDYSYERTILKLPSYQEEIDYLESLNRYITRNIKIINPTVEIAIREFLIAPIIAEIVAHTGAKLYSEYNLNVANNLRGTLDYFLKSKNSLIVIEAKQSDTRRGFNQLAVELIALDKSLKEETPYLLYGAVSNGDDWRFGILDRANKKIFEDIKLHRIPEELEKLVRILVGILNGII